MLNDEQRAFLTFHGANVHVYWRLVESAREWRATHPNRQVGMDLLFGRLRWDEAISTSGDPYRLNNYFASFYSRLIMHREPDLDGIFETRRSLADEPPRDEAQATLFEDAAAEDGWLEQAMRILDEEH